ncbi:MAG: Re/Si-specific NAD(P)(+) transhydrogenase subunit alpha [Fuerstiella sp.]|jgi:NAD(P) transhydrogenase subunit alpha|nr:Re/Si-specific NAD(P)(+) transhydrogenase subunit alpha [Fuerstiella sp.]
MSNSDTELVVAIPREADPKEKRVALVPAMIPALTKIGLQVRLQTNAGRAAGFPDQQYLDKGAKIESDRTQLLQHADIVLQVRALGGNDGVESDDVSLLHDGQVLIASCDPLTFPNSVTAVAEQGVTAFSLELVPRITRAQSMDILSSMATVAGYRAVLLAATAAPRMFPLMMTAAGTLKPARVLVIGAGVAGLQAIATAKRLGAVVYGYDIRPAVREQVESLGGKFVELDLESEQSETQGGYAKQMDEDFYRRQREAMKKVIADCDIVITTAAIPGRKAPILVTTEMVEAMAPGSVVVDLAAERGGNCEVTNPGETIDHNGVAVLGPCNMPSDVPVHASEMFSKNAVTFLQLMIEDGKLKIDLEDEIIRDTLLTQGNVITNGRVRELLDMEPLDPAASSENGGDSAVTDESSDESVVAGDSAAP